MSRRDGQESTKQSTCMSFVANAGELRDTYPTYGRAEYSIVSLKFRNG